MKEITQTEFFAIKDYARGLTECINNKMKEIGDEKVRIILKYVLQIIELHLELKELEVDLFLNNVEKSIKKT